MARFEFMPTPLHGVLLVQRTATADHRGFFSRFYCADEFASAGQDQPIVQINHTLTHGRGTVRGLHFQSPPHADCKIVSCLHGAVWDVVVDLRRDSPTFLQWHGEPLSADNRRSLLIPAGCAHGFQALEAGSELIYLHTATYRPEAEGALNVADPKLNIAWPLPITDLSKRDRSHPFIGADYTGVA